MIVRGDLIYRVLMKDSQYHAYYKIKNGRLWVVCLWSTGRPKPPRLGKPATPIAPKR